MTTKTPQVLIVEDEPKLAELLRDYLTQSGFLVACCDDGRAAIGAVRQFAPDVLLLDVMLPGRDGLDVLRELRTFSAVPVIMITARVEEIDRLLGLELGADDYVCKPFSPREVVARVRAVWRRAAGFAAPISGLLRLDAERFEAYVEGKPLRLTRTEFQLLNRLAEHPGRVYSRGQLLDTIYEDHRVVSDRTVDSHVKNLRRKLTDAAPGRDLVQSVYGMGYKLDL